MVTASVATKRTGKGCSSAKGRAADMAEARWMPFLAAAMPLRDAWRMEVLRW